jgi:hypothetical protein
MNSRTHHPVENFVTVPVLNSKTQQDTQYFTGTLMKHYLLNNRYPLANKCYIIYQNQINFSAECLSQDGDVCINQISVGNKHQLCIGSILIVIHGPGSASSGKALKNLIHTDFNQPLTTRWGTVQHKTAF